MDSAAIHHPSRQPSDAASLETEFYFEALRCEHERVLVAVRRAGSHLGVAPGTLAEYSAAHARLLQRFLDAQRGLLRRRAESDRVVNVIRAESEEAARSTLAAAHAEAVARMMRRALVAAHGSEASNPTLDEWDRLDAANEALGPMSGYLDVAGFNQIVDEEIPGPVGASDEMLGQLGRLLEQWWEVEQRGAGERAEHAVSRAALLERLVAIEAHEIVEAAGPLPAEVETNSTGIATPDVALPADLLAVLADADADALDDLLAGCVALLGGDGSDAGLDERQATAVVDAGADDAGGDDAGADDVAVATTVDDPEQLFAEPLLRFSDLSAGWPTQLPTQKPARAATTVVARPRDPADALLAAETAGETEVDESVGRQVATIVMRVVAPMAAFSMVFALLAWLVG